MGRRIIGGLLLAPEQSHSLIRYLKEHKRYQRALAQQLKVTPSNFSRQVCGQSNIPPRLANELYQLLGQPEELVFLTQPEEHLLLEHWRDLYRTHTTKLEGSYLQQPPELRGKILGELERLIHEYT